jgi:hypothetical protein
MENIFRESRTNSTIDGKKITMEKASELLDIDVRTLRAYEDPISERFVPPKTVLNMSEIYSDPHLRMKYCAEYCPIGMKDEVIHQSQDIFKSGYSLLHSIGELKNFQESLFSALADNVLDEDELENLSSSLDDIKELRGLLKNIVVEIEKHQKKNRQ